MIINFGLFFRLPPSSTEKRAYLYLFDIFHKIHVYSFKLVGLVYNAGQQVSLHPALHFSGGCSQPPEPALLLSDYYKAFPSLRWSSPLTISGKPGNVDETRPLSQAIADLQWSPPQYVPLRSISGTSKDVHRTKERLRQGYSWKRRANDILDS